MERTDWPHPCWSTLDLYHVAYHPNNDGSSYPLQKEEEKKVFSEKEVAVL